MFLSVGHLQLLNQMFISSCTLCVCLLERFQIRFESVSIQVYTLQLTLVIRLPFFFF